MTQTTKWTYAKLLPVQKSRLGEFGEWLSFVIREEGGLGSLAFVVTEDTARSIVEDHNVG